MTLDILNIIRYIVKYFLRVDTQLSTNKINNEYMYLFIEL